MCVLLYHHTLQENNGDDKARSTLVADRKSSAVDISATKTVHPGLGYSAHSKSDGSLLVKEKRGDSTEKESMFEGETS